MGIKTEKQVQAIVDQLRHDRTMAVDASPRRH
jgi:hypothetical protein